MDQEDTDVVYDQDGTPWIQTSGTGIAKDQRVERLEQMLLGVKDMYMQKYGRDADLEYDEDGTAWNVTEGTGVPRDLRVESLEHKLAEVKQLYAEKYSTEVEDWFQTQVGDYTYDSDGTLWIKSVTAGRRVVARQSVGIFLNPMLFDLQVSTRSKSLRPLQFCRDGAVTGEGRSATSKRSH